MSEGFEYVVNRGASTGIGYRPGEDERQIPKVGRSVFEFGEALDSDDRGYRPVASGYNEICPLLGVGDESRDATLGRFGNRDFTGLAQGGHA